MAIVVYHLVYSMNRKIKGMFSCRLFTVHCFQYPYQHMRCFYGYTNHTKVKCNVMTSLENHCHGFCLQPYRLFGWIRIQQQTPFDLTFGKFACAASFQSIKGNSNTGGSEGRIIPRMKEYVERRPNESDLNIFLLLLSPQIIRLLIIRFYFYSTINFVLFIRKLTFYNWNCLRIGFTHTQKWKRHS